MVDAKIQEVLASLVSLPVRIIGRTTNMLWVQFGELHKLRGWDGKTRVVGDWALHIQCPWRLTDTSRILIASGDVYYATEGDEPYDWDSDGESRFDRLASSLNRQYELSPPEVASVVVDAYGGFVLHLSNRCLLEVFPNESTGSDTEHWRLFRPSRSESHFVFPEAKEDAA